MPNNVELPILHVLYAGQTYVILPQRGMIDSLPGGAPWSALGFWNAARANNFGNSWSTAVVVEPCNCPRHTGEAVFHASN